MEDLVSKLVTHIIRMRKCYQNDDLQANACEYGQVLAYCDMIDYYGHEVVFTMQDEIDGYYVISEIAIDGKVLDV